MVVNKELLIEAVRQAIANILLEDNSNITISEKEFIFNKLKERIDNNGMARLYDEKYKCLKK